MGPPTPQEGRPRGEEMDKNKKKDKSRGPLRPWLVDVVVDIQR
jgi:hypothetical protein